VQAHQRILTRQPRKQCRVEVQRQRHLIAAIDRLGDDQLLFGGAATRRRRQPPPVGDQEIVNVVSDAHVVNAADQTLQPRQQHALSG